MPGRIPSCKRYLVPNKVARILRNVEDANAEFRELCITGTLVGGYWQFRDGVPYERTRRYSLCTVDPHDVRRYIRIIM